MSYKGGGGKGGPEKPQTVTDYAFAFLPRPTYLDLDTYCIPYLAVLC